MKQEMNYKKKTRKKKKKTHKHVNGKWHANNQKINEEIKQ